MNKLRIAGLTIILIIFLISCTDDPLKVGFELLPDVDLLEAGSDTLPVYGYVAKGYPGTAWSPDLSNTSAKYDKCAVGNVNDPVFGTTWAELLFEFTYPEVDAYEYDTSDVFLSCKLYLKIDPDLTFGDNAGFNINLYSLNKRFSYQQSTAYVVKSEDFNIDQNLAESVTHNFYYTGTDVPGLDSNNYYLVIDLSNDYFSGLIDNDIYGSSTDFKTKFPGFYMKPYATTETGSIETFLFEGSHFIMEYNRTYKDIEDRDSIVSEKSSFNIDVYEGLYRNESNYSPEGPFGNILGDTVNQSDNIYIQSLGGVRGFIHIPDLDTLRNNKSDSIGINFAEIVFPINPDFFDTINFYLPPRITLLDKISNGFRHIIDDDQERITYPGYSSGYLDPEAKEYRVNVTEYVHLYLQGSLSTGWFYISPSSLNFNNFSSVEYKAPGRAVLNSGNSSNPPFLRIIYTNTNN